MPWSSAVSFPLNRLGWSYQSVPSVGVQPIRFRRTVPAVFPDPLQILIGSYVTGGGNFTHLIARDTWLQQREWTLVRAAELSGNVETVGGIIIAPHPMEQFDSFPLSLTLQWWIP